MGLLDKLWDDTVAGPRPDSGLSKLRKHSTFSFRSAKEEAAQDAPAPKVTMSIMIKRPAGCPSPGKNGTPPASPAGSTPPVSPFAGGGGKEWNRFRRKSTSDYERPAGVVGPRSPPPPHEM